MNLEQIKQAIAQGYPVHWSSTAYDVIIDNVGQYLIRCNLNDSCIGLTWRDGVTMNGDEDEFFLGIEDTQ
jgi:hypothetical protein